LPLAVSPQWRCLDGDILTDGTINKSAEQDGLGDFVRMREQAFVGARNHDGFQSQPRRELGASSGKRTVVLTEDVERGYAQLDHIGDIECVQEVVASISLRSIAAACGGLSATSDLPRTGICAP
jgi:hypothetical protein